MAAPAIQDRDAPEHALREGDLLGGRYRLERVVGEGGMGVVWAARQVPTERAVAVKIVKDADAAKLARFLREARVSAALDHRNIVQIFDFGEVEERGLAFMVMELLRGETLASRLKSTGRLTLVETRGLLGDVLRALAAAHRSGVVHRDLKPENIFLAVDGEGQRTVKVLDFGLAKATDLASEATAITQTGAVMGTPFYMAPEQIYGEKTIDARADVWALGVVLYECLTGTRPFTGENVGQVFRQVSSGKFTPVREHVPTCPEELDRLVARMLEHDREARLASIDAVITALDAAVTIAEPLASPSRADENAVPAAERTQAIAREHVVGAPNTTAPVMTPPASDTSSPGEGAQIVTGAPVVQNSRPARGVSRGPVLPIVVAALAIALAAGIGIGMRVEAARRPAASGRVAASPAGASPIATGPSASDTAGTATEPRAAPAPSPSAAALGAIALAPSAAAEAASSPARVATASSVTTASSAAPASASAKRITPRPARSVTPTSSGAGKARDPLAGPRF